MKWVEERIQGEDVERVCRDNAFYRWMATRQQELGLRLKGVRILERAFLLL